MSVKPPRSIRLIQGVAVLATGLMLLLVAGLIYSANSLLAASATISMHTAQKPAQLVGQTAVTATRSSRWRVLALGDSLTFGFGDASGRGFAGDVRQQLQRAGRLASYVNLGVNGLTSKGLLQQLRQPEVQRLVATSNLLLVSIGGNDLRDAITPNHIQAHALSVAVRQFDTRLRACLLILRTYNPHALILLVGLYNPYLGELTQPLATTQVILHFNENMEELTAHYPGVVVVRTFDLFENHPSNWLTIDHFHPNEQGYARIAERVWQDLQGG